MKLLHVLLIVAAGIGILYVGHMVTAHQGSQILPGIGIK
jgi:hypothetical protein